MTTFDTMFKKIGFKKQEAIAAIQMMAAAGCFKKDIPTDANKEHLEGIKKIKGMNIPKEWAEFKEEISAKTASLILNFDFTEVNLQELLNYTMHITQIHMFKKQDALHKSHHYLEKDKFYELSVWQKQCIETLFSEKKWPNSEVKINHVILHPNKNLITAPNKEGFGIFHARVDALFKNIKNHGASEITIHLPTNPRGLEIREKFTAEIITKKILKDNKIDERYYSTALTAVQEVFSKTTYDWHIKPTLLQKAILEKLQSVLKIEKLEWPRFSTPFSAEYDDKADKAAEMEKKHGFPDREPLLGLWPTMRDLAEYLFSLCAEKYECTSKINLVVLPVLGKIIGEKYNVSGTEEHLKALQDYLGKSKDEMKHCAIVSDISHTLGGPRQVIDTINILSSAFKFSKCQFYPIYDGPGEQMNFDLCKQEYAKLIYTLYKIHAQKQELSSIFSKENVMSITETPHHRSLGYTP